MNRSDDVTRIQQAMEFCLWAAMQPEGGGSPVRVMHVFGCSRATAYRWLRAYRDALALAAARRFTTVESRTE